MSFNSVWNNKVKHSGALFIINLDVHYVWNKVVKLNSHTSGKKKKEKWKSQFPSFLTLPTHYSSGMWKSVCGFHTKAKHKESQRYFC